MLRAISVENLPPPPTERQKNIFYPCWGFWILEKVASMLGCPFEKIASIRSAI